MDPTTFLARLAALVPPSRHPLVRFHGRGAAVQPPPDAKAPSRARVSRMWKIFGMVFRVAVSYVSIGCVACVGEAAVSYKGTVAISDGDPGYSFDADPNPAALTPIAGASVALCVDCEASQSPNRASSDAMGNWGPLSQVFGGKVAGDNEIQLSVHAEGFNEFRYTAVYPSSEPTSGVRFLNVRLASSAH
jgi:hypothetical protein